ncbi:MAG TPA: MmgE/PrpD family protein [Candidatus Sulfotelmatobacter sp.]|nr:MmgE/PrpD family protein [Candidatus Sulfotelmatobacter sp.]
MNAPPSQGLTSGLVRLLKRPIDARDRARAALHVLDWLGCAAAGLTTPPGVTALAWARTLPTGRCHTVGGLRLSGRDAAFLNGSVGNVLEMDDFYRTALVHPGPIVVPTALAAAEETDAGPDALLDAIVRGFEAMIRIGRSVGPTHYKFFHNTATCGVFGAAAAAGALYRLADERLVDGLGNAGTQASGLWQCRLEDSMTKQLHNGRAAQSGLLAAQLAVHGFTGPKLILDGPLGFYNAMCPDGWPDRLLAEPEAPWLIHGTSFKPWPACRHTHPTIDAALAARATVDFAAIRRIVVETYRDALAVCDNPSPMTAVEAKFSLQHASAVVLLRGTPTLADFDVPATRDPEIAALRSKVELRERAPYTVAYPAHFAASLHVELADGRTITRDIPDALGDPENPLPDAMLCDKARALLNAGGYSPDAAEAVIAAALALSSGGTVDGLMRLVR